LTFFEALTINPVWRSTFSLGSCGSLRRAN
jgi:hypothetical protein